MPDLAATDRRIELPVSVRDPCLDSQKNKLWPLVGLPGKRHGEYPITEGRTLAARDLGMPHRCVLSGLPLDDFCLRNAVVPVRNLLAMGTHNALKL